MATRIVKPPKPINIYNGIQLPTEGKVEIKKVNKKDIKDAVKLEEVGKLKKGKPILALVNEKVVEVTLS